MCQQEFISKVMAEYWADFDNVDEAVVTYISKDFSLNKTCVSGY